MTRWLARTYLRMWFIIIHIFVKPFTTNHCNYRPPNRSELIIGINLTSPFQTIKLKVAPYSPIRIHLEYAVSFNSYINSEKLKNQVLIPARVALESMIKVKNPTQDILRVDRKCLDEQYRYYRNQWGCSKGCVTSTMCSKVKIPEKFLNKCKVMSSTGEITYSESEGAGLPNIDIGLIVEVVSCSGTTVASAVSCFLEAELDRPIMGIMNLCSGRIVAGENILSNIATIQHEIIHALGFAADKFAFYRYENGGPIVPRDGHKLPRLGFDVSVGAYKWNDYIAKEVTRTRSNIHGTYSKKIVVMTLPTILDIARKHFNCPTLDGLDLEDYPIISHFSEYILNNEIMTPQGNGAIDQISKFTLALLRDTGWYNTNLEMAVDFKTHSNTGCLFFDGCHIYMTEKKSRGLSIMPFCDRIYSYGHIYKCSEDRKFFYFCYIIKIETLPEKYQYFQKLDDVPDSEAHLYGGPSELIEFCPLLRITSSPNSVCSDVTNIPGNNKVNILDSYYGPDSLCFENDIHGNNGQAMYGASCQKYHFNKEKQTLTIFFDTITVTCPSDQTYLIPAKYNFEAKFTCPDTKNFPTTNAAINVCLIFVIELIEHSQLPSKYRVTQMFALSVNFFLCYDLLIMIHIIPLNYLNNVISHRKYLNEKRGNE